MEFTENDIKKLIFALKGFKGKYEKRLNFHKFCAYLETSGKKREALLDLLFEFQDLFKGILRNHVLTKEKDGNTIYLCVKPSEVSDPKDLSTISISKSQIKILNDIIHIFKTIRKGKGFNISNKNTDLINQLKNLYYSFPLLFRQNGHDLIYPTDIAIELGSKIKQYNKMNIDYKDIDIENYTFQIRDDERN
ncbi:MAG: hypothetical protein BAJALOKI2v1_540014 [Promethearchaeota archaeon]|nr:MAG: hypothetical protein BAJALOKI2v1_540014 [Candidatus Lokiarchaeota archaeon]